MLLRISAIIIVVVSALAPLAAHAQAGERAATAEDLFRQGLQLTKKGRFAEACPKFAESNRLDPAFGSLMNLGACYEKLGRTASAWQAYVDAADLARDKGQRARADSARKKASQLAPRLVRLEVRLGTGVDARGLAITRNDRSFDVALVGNAVPVDPGSYLLVAARAGAEPWKTSVTATEPGKTVVVELAGPVGGPPEPADAPPVSPSSTSGPPRAPGATPVPRAPAESVHETQAGAPGRSLRVAGITVAAGGVAMVATGGAFAWLSRSISNDITHAAPGARFDPAREDRAKTYQTSAFVLWGVGAAAIAGGATLYFVGHRRAETSVTLAPVPHGGVAAVVSGQW
jgi:serine/threonine-protein kinase